MKNSARAVALDALCAGGDAAAALDKALGSADLSAPDRAFATELAYGTRKMSHRLEWAVAQCLTRAFADVETHLRWILLLGAYQLLFLDRVPAHSAVDESVKLARLRGRDGAAGFVNAVLRKVSVLRPVPPVPEPAGGAPALGLWASLPDWIAAHLIERFGFETAVKAAEGMNAPPRRALRIDLRRLSREAFIERLAHAGVAGRAGRYGIPECVVIDDLGDGRAVRAAVASGEAAWQSEESQLAVHVLDPQPGEMLIDVCAGRGVKTMMIAQRLRGEGAVWSIDDDERKLGSLRSAAEAAGAGTVRVVRADARRPLPEEVPASADAVLVDAPCSGLGVIGRRADARWRKKASDPARFAAVQAAMLRNASARVRPGGRLLYVTCSTHPSEDEAVVDAFVAKHPGWRSAGVEPHLITPGIDGADGFYYALLRRDPEIRA